MGVLLHDFGKYNDIISRYMDRLGRDSLSVFDGDVSSNKVRNVVHELAQLNNCINCVEKILYYYYQNDPDNFPYILSCVRNSVGVISVLEPRKRGIYGQALIGSKILLINPDLGPNGGLTGYERMELYMAHEIGHMINYQWVKKAEEFCTLLKKKVKLSDFDIGLISSGFDLLDEAITQNRAEEFIYKTSGKKRPELVSRYSNRLFGGQPYRSNFDFYGELEEPTIMFARTLRGLGKEKDDMKVLNTLSKWALSDSFYNDIIDEYLHDNQIQSLIDELKLMGCLKRASYANFGYDEVDYLINSKYYLNQFKDIAGKLKDDREPIIPGHIIG